ncbi:hypothetical protein G7059_02260 [Erysipelothrix sp. HDW6A]|nr:hypothetical protein [Erysipelothrix sp. HDW6A]QIK56755.1 hypothetical protein G7059_02260 [Erysipelothrix sp. HDW6A]
MSFRFKRFFFAYVEEFIPRYDIMKTNGGMFMLTRDIKVITVAGDASGV